MKPSSYISAKDEQKIISDYVRAVKKEIIATRTQRQQLFDDLKADIHERIADGKIADYDDIVAHFGTPEQVAKDFSNTADIKEVKRMILHCRILVTAIVCCAVTFFGYYEYKFYDVYNASHTYTTETFEVDGQTIYEDILVEDHRHGVSDVLSKIINRKDSEQ